LGWIIKTKENKFDKNSFVFMDYRIRDKNSTAFTYVLPFKSNKALIEHTYFSKNECEKKVYESYIEEYIQNYYSNSDYEIIKSESGVIPMTSYPFYKDSSKKITRIGTSGGWIKPTTGYSFSNCEKYSMKILEYIKKGQNPTIISKKKYRFLDKIFLGVLSLYNDKGELIFYKMIKKNKTQTILRFLNEESSLMDEIKIIFSLRSMDFIKVFIQSLYKKGL
jgi:lycopene beta-cyclase